MVKLAGIGKARLGPGALDDVEDLGEAIAAFLVGDLVRVLVLTTPLRPTPKMSRPWLSWSTVAASSARRSGWHSGRTCTAMPILMRFVRAAIALAIGSGADK